MTVIYLADCPLPLDKPLSEWDELDYVIAETRAAEVAAAIQPACEREKHSRNTYVRPDSRLFSVPLRENFYH